MSSVAKKKVTVKSDIWLLDGKILTSVGFQQSPLFGTKSTKFYWRAVKTSQTNYSLHLYCCIAACIEEKVNVDVKVLFGKENPPTMKYFLNGEISLDRTRKLGWNGWSLCSLYTSTEITFEESDFAPAQFPQEKHYEALSSQLLNLRENINSADITLLTTGDKQKFPVHKNILASRSAVFAAMFQHNDFIENKKNRVEIDDVTGEVMDALLKYIYSADLQGVEKIAEHLLPAADKYDIPLLVDACVESLQSSLSIENALRFFILADLHHLEGFKAEIVKFIKPNLAAIRESADWKKCINLELLQQLFDLLLLIPRK